MATDPPQPEAIRELTFPRSWAWRGYDRAEVDRFLDRLAGWLDQGNAPGRTADSSEMESELIATLEKTIEGLEREVANGRRREKRLVAKLEEAQARPSPPRPSARRRTRGARRVNLNEATFVDLRSLGLGVAGAARLIALRDIRGEFENLDVLDELEGYPDATIEKLKKRLYVSPDA